MTERLLITGMGAVTPVGNNIDEYWHAILAGQCGVSEISRFDVSRLPVKIAAEIRNFDATAILPKSTVRATSPFIHYSLVAAEEALTMARLKNHDKNRVGICMGTAMAGMGQLAFAGAQYEESNTGKLSPHLVPGSIANMACSYLGIAHDFRGPGLTISTACSAGNDAVIAAASLILADSADVVVVMGGESILAPAIISSLAQAHALSRNNDQPEYASRPFDRERDGFVIGEGGGAIILERERHALKRGAPVFAELKGWGNTLDSYHITAPDPEGCGAALCMQKALAHAGLSPQNIDYINAHGTSTRLGDAAETLALKKAFSNHVPPVSSTKGCTGHLMGAGGLTELIACIKSIEDGIAPPTINLRSPDPDCDLDYIPERARKMSVNIAMSNAIGFGGQNSSLIVARYP